MTRIQGPFYPIIYIRGFAGSATEVEDTVATPYMGFNLGATKIRQNHAGKPVRFIFESPLIRLMKDHDYVDTYKNGALLAGPEPVNPRSIWIFRYYEPSSEELGDGETRSIVQFATELDTFINTVRERVCADQDDHAAFRCYLVAHSMGGLIARCYLQNIAAGRASLVDKVFTYATPHNGIDMLGVNVPDLGWINRDGSSNFNRGVMRDYLAIGSDTAANSLDGKFPTNRMFCLVGTNYRDYEAVMGLSRRATGAMSDGLVRIQNATVLEAPRAYVHRAHSGDYGIVNSEEGYQNLRRFLFGDRRVDVRLHVMELTLPPDVQKQKDSGKRILASYHVETTAGVRGANYHLHERLVAHESAAFEQYDDLVKDGNPVYLFSGFLLRSAKVTSDTALAFALHVAIEVPVFEVEKRLWFDSHYEGGRLLDETVTFEVRPGDDGPNVRYGLASRHGPGRAPTRAEVSGGKTPGEPHRIVVPLGFTEGSKSAPRPGFRGELWLDVGKWNEW